MIKEKNILRLKKNNKHEQKITRTRFKILKKIIIFIDDKREYIEDIVADKYLKALDESSVINALEEKVIVIACEVIQAYLTTYNVPEIPADVKKQISKQIVKGISKANKLLQKQLRKKSKRYKEIHTND